MPGGGPLPVLERTPDMWYKRAKDTLHLLGVNPTVDLVALRGKTGGEEILLVLRSGGAVEGGRWALPGGFINTDAQRGERWKEGRESPREAAVRETLEETGVSVDPGDLIEVGVFEGGGRDPRDSPESWTKSHAFAVRVDGSPRARGGDDASDAEWFPLEELPTMAFDHREIVSAALRKLGRREKTAARGAGAAREAGSGDHLTLGDLVTLKVGMKDADFWIIRRGSPDRVGTPVRDWGPELIGVKVERTDLLLPDYLFHMIMHIANTGYFRRFSTGTAGIKHITISDVANIPIGR